jgi:uncharacterized protein YndB with AHSA1/START domain
VLSLNEPPVAKTEMTIHRPVDEVFGAFIDPAVTTRFWFSRSSGRLEAGQTVQWYWDAYGVSAVVNVEEVVPHERIRIEWDEGVAVEWTFATRGPGETHVTITSSGFQGDGDSVVRQAVDSTQGFTIVLCGLKAFLEHGIELNLVPDKSPDARVDR